MSQSSSKFQKLRKTEQITSKIASVATAVLTLNSSVDEAQAKVSRNRKKSCKILEV